jgi:hypothetical protein
MAKQYDLFSTMDIRMVSCLNAPPDVDVAPS